MAEIIQRDGTWHFDGETVRIVPGRGKGIHPLRQELGERAVPLRALAGISFEPDSRSRAAIAAAMGIPVVTASSPPARCARLRSKA
ncbi:DUF4429 domain-containing protein, partial [Streptomyces sp. NPDC088184]|uniref:DUF4429 domain-containing protein n=1 Tax=Streptomyces sp. NPDC088184 TaxID=3160991 RepID=UPI00344272E2